MQLAGVIILALVLRLINLDKPEGLWNDEYVSWFVASTPFAKGFWQEVLKQCHMPLYYLYLKPFSNCSDFVLRLTSVLPSVLAVPVMYLTGKEYSKKTALQMALVTAVLSFLIYYAQEVRFYSLLFLFSSLMLFFTVRIKNCKKGLLGYVISAMLVLLTHVLGIIYVCFNTLYLKKKSKYVIPAFIFVAILLFPIGINILRMLPSSQWWSVFSLNNILFLFSDFYSPILTNNVNVPQVFFYNKDFLWMLLILVPTLIGLYGFIRGSLKERGLFCICIAVIITMSALALSGKVVFITKYLIEILPIMILLFVLGMQNKYGNLLYSIFIIFHLFAVFTPYYTAKIYRSEGHKLVCDVINKQNPNKIVFTYYDKSRFERYLEINVPSYWIDKTMRFVYLDNPSKILEDVKIGERVSVVFLDSVSFIPENLIEESKTRNLPEMFITFSVIKHSLLKAINDNYRDYSVDKNGSWTVVTATRFK